MILLDNF